MTDKQHEIELAEVAGVMSTVDGRNTMYRILEWPSLNGDNFNENPYRHAHNSGRESIGKQLKRELKEADVNLYNQMVKEHD